MWLWAAPNKEEKTFSYTPILPFGWHIPPKGQSICLVLEERSYEETVSFLCSECWPDGSKQLKKSQFEIRKTSQYLSLGNGKKELESYFSTFFFLTNENWNKRIALQFQFSFKAEQKTHFDCVFSECILCTLPNVTNRLSKISDTKSSADPQHCKIF